LKWWENCAKVKIERELKKTANEDVNEIVLEWFVSVRVPLPPTVSISELREVVIQEILPLPS
jgi:hypothetical protein